jgi:hypothetical protein
MQNDRRTSQFIPCPAGEGPASNEGERGPYDDYDKPDEAQIGTDSLAPWLR